MTFTVRHALSLLVTTCLVQAVAWSQQALPPSESSLSRDAAQLADWVNRLHATTFEIIRRIGPPAIPLLVDLLRDEGLAIRRNAADALIDFAPHTERIQPALRRALSDADAMVAGDAARALGALGSRASVPQLIAALKDELLYVRIFAA